MKRTSKRNTPAPEDHQQEIQPLLPTRSQPKRQTSSRTRYIFYGISFLTIAVIGAILIRSKSSGSSGSTWTLSDRYALCSEDGRKSVYTSELDVAVAECVVVKGEDIQYVGDRCE